MKQEYLTYLKLDRKSKALATTLSDTKPKIESDDSDDAGILNAFTATVDPTAGVTGTIDDEEDLVDSKFEKMEYQDDIHTAYAKLYKVSKKHEKLYRLATKRLSDVELDREELSTKVYEVNQTLGALRFENNFLAERTKKLEAELFQVRAQLLNNLFSSPIVQLEKPLAVQLDELSHLKSLFTRSPITKYSNNPHK